MMLVLYAQSEILSIDLNPKQVKYNFTIWELIMNLKHVNLTLEVGQEILVGHNDKRAKITKIEFHEKSGDLVINTTEGPRRALNFRLCEQKESHYSNPADKYR